MRGDPWVNQRHFVFGLEQIDGAVGDAPTIQLGQSGLPEHSAHRKPCQQRDGIVRDVAEKSEEAIDLIGYRTRDGTWGSSSLIHFVSSGALFEARDGAASQQPYEVCDEVEVTGLSQYRCQRGGEHRS